MKKIFILNVLLLVARAAQAQETTAVQVAPFWQDKTFLMLIGGAVFLIILLIVKKVLEKRSSKENNTTENYEDTNI